MDKKFTWIEFVKERMKVLGIKNPAELSRLLGKKNHTTVSNWFTRKPKDPPIRVLNELAVVLECFPEEILAGKLLPQTNTELSRLISMLGNKEQFLVNSIIQMIAIDSNLLSIGSLDKLKRHKDWYITIDASQKKTLIAVTPKTKKPKKQADINLQVFFT